MGLTVSVCVCVCVRMCNIVSGIEVQQVQQVKQVSSIYLLRQSLVVGLPPRLRWPAKASIIALLFWR